jgi:hypothetical protein
MSSSSKSRNRNSGTRTIVQILYWVTVIVGLWFAWLNIQPYAQFVKAAMATATADAALIKLIAAIPIINGIAATIGTALHWVVGLLIWLVIQTVEVFPIILKRDRSFMKVLIDEAQSSQKFAIRDSDDPALSALKRWYNNFPTLTMTNARNLALFVYTIDFLICVGVYPPCKGGFGQLMFILMTGQWSLLDWGNIALLVITLFAIETIIRFLFWLGQIAYFMKSAHSL